MSQQNDVFITGVSIFYPNESIDNEHMEDILGFAGDKPSRSRNIILRSNGIRRVNSYIQMRNWLPMQ